MKFKIILSAVLILAVLGCALYLNKDLDNVDMTLDLIISRIDAKGNIVDYSGDIGMTGYKDVGWYMKDTTYYITYGKLELKLTDKDFANQAILDKLEQVGIKVLRNTETGEYRFYYQDELMDQWAK